LKIISNWSKRSGTVSVIVTIIAGPIICSLVYATQQGVNEFQQAFAHQHLIFKFCIKFCATQNYAKHIKPYMGAATSDYGAPFVSKLVKIAVFNHQL